jgi:hypothetical protein
MTSVVAARPVRRGRRSARVELCLAAFAPAFGLMVWRAWGDWLLVVAFGAPCVVGLVVFALFLKASQTGNAEPYPLGDISDSSSDVLGHIGAYLAVAIIDPTASTDQAILSLVVFGLIFLIHVSVGLVHVNPLFYVAGYRVYNAISEQGRTYYLIARSEVADWKDPKPLVRMGESILIEQRKRAST